MSCSLVRPVQRAAPARVVSVRDAGHPDRLVHAQHLGDQREHLRRGHVSSSPSTLLFGPAPATVALAIDTFVLSWRKGYAWQRVAFNTVGAGAVAVGRRPRLLPDRPAPRRCPPTDARIGPLIPALFFLATIYFALNSGLIAMAVGLESRRPPFQIWLRAFPVALDRLLRGGVGRPRPDRHPAAGRPGRGCGDAAVCVAIFHHTLRASFGRLEDARRHVTQIDRLYHSTVETLAMAIDAKDDVTHSHVRRVQAYAAGAGARAEGRRRDDARRPSRRRRCCTTRASWRYPSGSSTSREG